MVIYGIVVANLSLQNKYDKDRFFEKTFLLANTSMKIVLGILFFSLSNANIWFVKRKLKWKKYIITKILPTKKRVKLENCKEFVATALDPKEKAFVIYIALLKVQNKVHLLYTAKIALLITDKILVKVSKKYVE